MKNPSMKLTTAQFAKLHGINKRTLHYYDNIGLFSPLYKGENNYRYYDYSQCMTFEYILMLKELKMSIEEIKSYLDHPNADNFLKIADTKITDIDKEIQKLKRTKYILQDKKRQLSLCCEVENHEIRIINLKSERYLLTTPFDFRDDNIERALECLRQTWDADQYRAGFGSYISVDKVMNNDFDEYDGLFVPIRKKVKDDNLALMPCGKYICGYLIGDWDNIPGLYAEILAFAHSNQIELTGNAYETGLNEFAISDMKQYTTQVMIKIKD